MSATLIQEVPLREISRTGTQPRKHFDKEKLEELTESVRKHGVLEPIIVRPAQAGRDGYELVAGERRFRAANEAGLLSIPVTVRDLDDKEVLEIQMIENMMRADLEPIEEAEGYYALHHTHKLSVGELAARLGRSETYVYQRMQLTGLPSEARELLAEGKLQVSVALLVAQIPVERIRLEAARTFAGVDPKTGKPYRGNEAFRNNRGPMNLQEARNEYRRRFATRLHEVPWKLEDETLCPAAGACTACPKRTGAQVDLFGTADKRDDACTDPDCFGAKREAHKERLLEAARSRGDQVLTGREAKKALEGSGGYQSGEYVDIKERNHRDPNQRQWSTLVGKSELEKIGRVVVVTDDGEVKELVPRKKASAVIREKHEWAKPQPREAASTSRNKISQRNPLTDKINEETEKRYLAEVVSILEEPNLEVTPADVWRLLAYLAMGADFYSIDNVLTRRKLTEPRKKGTPLRAAPNRTKAFESMVSTMSAAEVRALAVELLLASILQNNGNVTYMLGKPKDNPELGVVAEVLGVDLAKVYFAVKQEIEAEAKAEAEAKKAKGKKAKKKTAKAAPASKKPRPRKKAASNSDPDPFVDQLERSVDERPADSSERSMDDRRRHLRMGPPQTIALSGKTRKKAGK